MRVCPSAPISIQAGWLRTPRWIQEAPELSQSMIGVCVPVAETKSCASGKSSCAPNPMTWSLS